MFVDEKKVGEIQIDTRSDLERFIAWAKARDPNETYIYTLPRHCLIARWDQSEGRNEPRTSVQIRELFDGRGKEVVLYKNEKGVMNTGYDIRTIGGALAVALQIQKDISILRRK